MDQQGPLSQERVTAIYDRNARFYDTLEAGAERFVLSRQRRRLFADLRGLVLEIGTGTGKNLAYLRERDDIELIAIDPSTRMLERAAARARHLGRQVELHAATAQRLPFGDADFDAVIASFVFCSVASPMAGLREARRVLRPGGALRLLEHQRPATPWLAPLFDLVNPVAVRLTGANVNRRTEENVKNAGFDDVSSLHLDRFGILRFIEGRKA